MPAYQCSKDTGNKSLIPASPICTWQRSPGYKHASEISFLKTDSLCPLLAKFLLLIIATQETNTNGQIGNTVPLGTAENRSQLNNMHSFN